MTAVPSVGHMQPSASTARITTAHVQVSFDHGRTWSGAAVTTAAPGRFAASYTAPRRVPAAAAWLRAVLRAVRAAGGGQPGARGLFDVTTGNNDFFNGSGGASCDLTYLCVAGKSYDCPTGLGTPDGIGAF